MKEYQVMSRLKLGDNTNPGVGGNPKWLTIWYDCEYLKSIVGDDLDNFQVEIYVPEFDYHCTVDNFYLRIKPE